MEQKGKTSLQCLKTAHQLLANLIQIHRVSHHLIGCKQDLMGAIQPAANAALLTFGCCQAINEGIFCSVSTTVGRCVKSLTLLHEVI